LKNPDLKGYLSKDTGNEDLIIVNSAIPEIQISSSSPEIQTILCYCNIIIPTDTKAH